MPNIDSDSTKALSRYFLPYQVKWIADDSRKRIAEKSVRIGWTYADAFKNVRKRLHFPKRDYLFASKDEPTAVEYVETCLQFCQIYNLTKSIISRGVENCRVPRYDEQGKDTGFTEDVKVGHIKFDNGSRILAFSSNPNALRAYGGDVGLDEFAFHPRADALWATAAGRIRWGYDLGVWSSHNGEDSLFNQFVLEARQGIGGWSFHRCTIEDAVVQGLVRKINEVRGTDFSDEGYIKAAREDAKSEERYQEEYMCNPKGGTDTIVSWSSIVQCATGPEAEREHLEHDGMVTRFGAYKPGTKETRRASIGLWLRTRFPALVARKGRHSLGFDVAASGQGHLCSMWIDSVGHTSDLAALFTCRTEDWDFIKAVLRWFLEQAPRPFSAAGDNTGLGRDVCWTMEEDYKGIFQGVNFSGEKHDMGFALMTQLQAVEQRWPKSFEDVSADHFALRKTFAGGKYKFTEGSNLLNPASHCDIAWSDALSTRATTQAPPDHGMPSPFRALMSRLTRGADRRIRTLQ